MLVITVHVRVKPDCVEAFAAASAENSRHSRQEPGIARFDVLQSTDDPSRFMLLEVYRDPAATAAHKETAHYLAWREAVADMMAEPRSAAKYTNLHPGDETW